VTVPVQIACRACNLGLQIKIARGSLVDAIEATGSSSNSAMRFSSRGIASRICVGERLADFCCVGGADLLRGMTLGRESWTATIACGYLLDPVAPTDWRYAHGKRAAFAPLAGLIGNRGERQDAE
jgi:hypothetical protein